MYGGQSSLGAGFLRVLRLALPFFMPPSVPNLLIVLSLTLYGFYIDSVVKQHL
jgi:hypothetical protein